MAMKTCIANFKILILRFASSFPVTGKNLETYPHLSYPDHSQTFWKSNEKNNHIYILDIFYHNMVL